MLLRDPSFARLLHQLHILQALGRNSAFSTLSCTQCCKPTTFTTTKIFRCIGFTADIADRARYTTKIVGRDAGGKTSLADTWTRPYRLMTLDAQRGRHTKPAQRDRGRQDSTKDVTAYCAAESYNLSTAQHLLRQDGCLVEPVITGSSVQVLHVKTPHSCPSTTDNTTTNQNGPDGDLFIFSSGTLVAWNVPAHICNHILVSVLSGAAEHTYAHHEVEDFHYIESPQSQKSEIIGDTIQLGTAIRHDPGVSQDAAGKATTVPSVDVVSAKVAYSSALARSTKLAVLEELLTSYFDTTRSIVTKLSAGDSLPFSRQFILRKTGELHGIRAQLNLYSELTDSLPDLFWDSPQELEQYYETLGRALDVGVRIRVLNQKMDYASEIAAVLSQRLSEKTSTMLEWLIIGLISIEVAFGIFHLVKETQEQEELTRVRHLLERYLEMEITNRQTKS